MGWALIRLLAYSRCPVQHSVSCFFVDNLYISTMLFNHVHQLCLDVCGHLWAPRTYMVLLCDGEYIDQESCLKGNVLDLGGPPAQCEIEGHTQCHHVLHYTQSQHWGFCAAPCPDPWQNLVQEVVFCACGLCCFSVFNSKLDVFHTVAWSQGHSEHIDIYIYFFILVVKSYWFWSLLFFFGSSSTL